MNALTCTHDVEAVAMVQAEIIKYRKGTKQGFKRFYDERKTTNRRKNQILQCRGSRTSQ